MATIQLTIDGVTCVAETGATILEAARSNGIHIPTLCHFEGMEGRANCRICVVEVENQPTLQPACVTRVSEGMTVHTNSERVRASRKTTLELILSHHAVDCHHCLRIGSSSEQSLDPSFCEMCFWCDCVRDGFCELQALAREYHVDVLPYVQHEKDYQEDVSLDSIIRNPNKCVKCRRCVDVCGEIQTVHNLSMAHRGHEITVVPELGKPMAESACVRCGRCVDVCPVGAIYMKEHKDEVVYLAHSYDTDVIAQLSGNVLPELNRLYKLDEDTITEAHVCAALHKIGVKAVISDAHARFLSSRQAARLIEESNGSLILTDSRAVVNFVDRYFPEMRDQVKTYESAQSIFGRMVKEARGDRPLVSINVTAVKESGAEARETHNVDYVLNARELYRIFLRTGGAPARRTPAAYDRQWDEEPLLYPELLGEKGWNLESEPEEVRIRVGTVEKRCAVAHNLGQVRTFLEGAWKDYDIIRLLA